MEVETVCPCCGKAIVLNVSSRPAPTSLSRPPYYPLEPQQRRPDGSLMPAPMTDERAANFAVPFGKYQGRTIADIATTDLDYLRWGAEKWDRGLGRAVKHFLAQLDSQPDA